ncbi:MAG TPA: RecX family transcriptional regulator [Spirochaetota bacterium]|nr:RecX family transcriptional regulator [Spirochaetota bacterium]
MGNDDLRRYAYDVSLRIIGASLQSEKSLREKLKKKEFDEGVISEVVNDLKEEGYIDDYKNGLSYALSLIGRKYYGKNYARKKLAERGIDRETSDEILSYIETTDYDETESVAKYLDKIGGAKSERISSAEYQKISNKRFNRGFSPESIKRALEREF